MLRFQQCLLHVRRTEVLRILGSEQPRAHRGEKTGVGDS